MVAPLTAGGAVVGLLTLAADAGTEYDDADAAFASELGQRLATMVAAERVAAQRRQLHELTVRLSAAGSVAEAAAAVSAGLRTVLSAEVVSVCTIGAGTGCCTPSTSPATRSSGSSRSPRCG